MTNYKPTQRVHYHHAMLNQKLLGHVLKVNKRGVVIRIGAPIHAERFLTHKQAAESLSAR